MTFALETQHGKKFRYGVRIEEMLIVLKDGIEIVSNFPVKQITVVDPLVAAWRAQRTDAPPTAVRSSALIEDRAGANFAGQFESFLGLDNEADVLTAVRACWAALWTTNARRYMENNGLNPADTAMAVLIQPVIDARASGGGLSETAEGQMLISATWGLGSAIAQEIGRAHV